MLCLFSASMSAFEYKGINYSVLSSTDQTVTLAAPNTVSGEITIPKLVMDAATSTAYRVVSISDNAFKDCTELTSVIFKAELISIGKSAFENTGLTSIVIPEAITVINESTFAGCSSLTNITLSSATTSIGKSAFANSGLTSIVIPEGVTTINESTFYGCASLASVTLSSASTSIGKSAFANSGLTSIVIPEGVTTINESTFSGCASLTSVALPSKLGSIGNNAFKNSGITSLDLTKTTKSIGNSAFEGCTGLKTVNYSYEVASIGTDAFKGCTALEELNLVFEYGFVDLGLPSGTLWATCNVGASSPEEYGDYFAWGETEPQADNAYSWSSYKWCNGSDHSMTKYCTSSSYGTVDNKTVLDAEDDAATANWGVNWCMPTIDQIKELCNSRYTTTTWTTQNGVRGYMIKSRTNGNSIFLPATGYRRDGSLNNAGFRGYYWLRSLNTSVQYSACNLEFGEAYFDMYYWSRRSGQSVRPVRSK